MSLKSKIYLSPLGMIISGVLNFFSFWHRPFMVYGHFNRKRGQFQKRTRISSSAKLLKRAAIDIGDNVWIGHYCLLDGISGITIGEGVHVASHSCIYTHSSQDALRLLGRKYLEVPAEKRPGYILRPVSIGEYTFIGTSAVILPGVTIGKGCIIGAGSVVAKDVPDFAIAAGNPAQVIGDTRKTDEELLKAFRCEDTYYLKK
ncbi:MAG: acyltransferase [Bacteroidota bacterium]